MTNIPRDPHANASGDIYHQQQHTALGFYDMRAVCMSGGYKNTHSHYKTGWTPHARARVAGLGSWEIIVIGKEGCDNISNFLWDKIIQSNAQAASPSICDAGGGGLALALARTQEDIKVLWVQPNSTYNLNRESLQFLISRRSLHQLLSMKSEARRDSAAAAGCRPKPKEGASFWQGIACVTFIPGNAV